MAGEADAEHVEDFALQPIGRQVHAGRGSRLKSIRDLGLDADPLVVRKTVDDVDQVEPFRSLGPIHRRDVHQVVEVGFQLQVFEHGDSGFRFGHHEVLPQIG